MNGGKGANARERRGPGMGPGPGGPRPGGPGPGGMMPGEKARDFKGTIKKLAGYLNVYKIPIIIVWLMAVISTVFAIYGPTVMGRATDRLFEGLMAQISGTGGIDFGAIAEILLFLAALYGISAAFSYAQSFIMSGVTAKVTFELRRDINDKVHRLPFSYFDRVTHGEVLSRVTNDVDTVSQSLNQSITQIITSVTSVVGILIMMIRISWQLTLVALCVIPMSLVFVLVIVRKSQKHFFNQQRFLGNVNGHVEEMFDAHTVVKAFNGEAASISAFTEMNDNLHNATWRSNFLSGMMMPITGFIGNIGYVGICILGGSYAARGALTVGNIQSFIQYVRNFNMPVTQIANISNVLQQTAAAAERVFEFLAEAEETPDVGDAEAVSAKGIGGRVAFDHVSFGYKAGQPVIKDFSADTEQGHKIAIVGPTGAGKTTIVKLLMRFYDVDSGSITVDGHDIRMFRRNELRQMFGMVLQDTWLFGGSIEENIRYGRLDATREQVEAAAQAAQADHFIRTLPGGYDMPIDEEAGNISQGQKQLLTIARAILADPQILILDEATSSVDTRTELLIQKAMDNLMRGRTSFIIAHRLSTIREADMILVMDGGDIVETGTHEALLLQDGFYARLYNSQFARAG